MKEVPWHALALDGIPSGFVAVDLEGNLAVINQSARHILGLGAAVETGSSCRRIFAKQPEIITILFETTRTLKTVNREEIKTKTAHASRLAIGYGTLVFKNDRGEAFGVGMIFQDITRFIPLPLTVQFVSLLARFFVPFAVMMVAGALYLGFAEPREQILSCLILAGVILFNFLMVRTAKGDESWHAWLRIIYSPLNFAGILALVYFLGIFWGPMWLLHVFTPLSVSLHSSALETFGVAFISAVSLLVIYAVRGLSGSVGWGQAVLHALFILFISLFVNSLANLVAKVKGSKAA